MVDGMLPLWNLTKYIFSFSYSVRYRHCFFCIEDRTMDVAARSKPLSIISLNVRFCCRTTKTLFVDFADEHFDLICF